MHSHRLPGGEYQHSLVLSLTHRPPKSLEGSIEALDNLESGFQQPLVEIAERLPNGRYMVLISVFSEDEEPSPKITAALQGTMAELFWHDKVCTAQA